jgi:hypothetical protein
MVRTTRYEAGGRADKHGDGVLKRTWYFFSMNSKAGRTSPGGPSYSGKQFVRGCFGIMSSNRSFLLRNIKMGVSRNRGFLTMSSNSCRLSCIRLTVLSSNSTAMKTIITKKHKQTAQEKCQKITIDIYNGAMEMQRG